MKKTFLAFALLATMVGCVTEDNGRSISLTVDSISDGTTPAKYFVIKPGLRDTSETDLRFLEFARFTENALIVKGFRPAPKNVAPDVVVTIFYATSDPKMSTVSYSVPVYGGGTTTTVANAYGQTVGTVKTRPTNPFVPTSYQNYSYQVTEYTRTIIIKAFDVKNPTPQNESPMKWETKITSTDGNGDMRVMYPYMMVAAMNYLGTNTERQINSRMEIGDNEDRRVCIIRYGTKCPSFNN